MLLALTNTCFPKPSKLKFMLFVIADVQILHMSARVNDVITRYYVCQRYAEKQTS